MGSVAPGIHIGNIKAICRHRFERFHVAHARVRSLDSPIALMGSVVCLRGVALRQKERKKREKAEKEKKELEQRPASYQLALSSSTDLGVVSVRFRACVSVRSSA